MKPAQVALKFDVKNCDWYQVEIKKIFQEGQVVGGPLWDHNSAKCEMPSVSSWTTPRAGGHWKMEKVVGVKKLVYLLSFVAY